VAASQVDAGLVPARKGKETTMAQAASSPAPGAAPASASRLFAGSCVALISGAAMFAVTSDILGALKQQFVLSNEQVAWIMSGGTWGFTLSIFALGPLCDALGMGRLVALALVTHAAGSLMMIFANGFWMLFAGALVNAIGSGAVEAACNPLIATIYPDRKTEKLNVFHMWFPGGIVLGGVACYALRAAGLGDWQLRLALVLMPTVLYGLLFLGQRFPATERVQAGVSFGGMVRETLRRPLFWVLLGCMMLTASLELGPARWIPAVLEAGGVPGILVLVWITGLMAVLRLFAGPVVRVLTNTGVLLASAVVGGVGLALLSFATSWGLIAVAATVFAIGVCYFWPTMIGTAAERIPKGGAFVLAILGGAGGLVAGAVTAPLMGRIADHYLHRELVRQEVRDGRTVDHQAETVAALKDLDATYARWAEGLGDTPADRVTRDEVRAARDAVGQALAAWSRTGTLPAVDTANAFRVVLKSGPAPGVGVESGAARAALAAKTRAEALLRPADNKGGLMSFRYVAPASLVLVVVFGLLHLRDRRAARAPAGGDLPPQR